MNIDSTPGAVGFVPRYTNFVYPVRLIQCDQDTGEPLRNAAGRCMLCAPGEPGVLIGKVNKERALNSFGGYADKVLISDGLNTYCKKLEA